MTEAPRRIFAWAYPQNAWSEYDPRCEDGQPTFQYIRLDEYEFVVKERDILKNAIEKLLSPDFDATVTSCWGGECEDAARDALEQVKAVRVVS